MQAKLPDVNAAIVRHRSAALAALRESNYVAAIISFDAIIALLPDDYKVEINTEKYNQLCTEKKTITCESCTASMLLKDVMMYMVIEVPVSSFLSGQEYTKVWDCTACKKMNRFNPTNIKITKFQEPCYFKVAPAPPGRRGINNRKTYHFEFNKWFDIMMSEIESQIGIYRADYAAQQNTSIPTVQEDGLDGSG